MAKVIINIPLGSNLITPHNNLPGLQGSSPYIHLSQEEYDNLNTISNITYGSGLRNDGGVIKLGMDPQNLEGIGSMTEDTLLIRTENPTITSTSILMSDQYNEGGDPVVTNIQTIVYDGEDAYSSYINSQISDQDGVITPQANAIITTPVSSKGIMISAALGGIVVSDGIDEKGLVGEAYFGDNATDNTYIQKKYVDDLVQTRPITLIVTIANTIQHDRLIGLDTSTLDFPFMIQADNQTWTEYPTDIFPDLTYNSTTGTITGFTVAVGKAVYITINEVAYIT